MRYSSSIHSNKASPLRVRRQRFARQPITKLKTRGRGRPKGSSGGKGGSVLPSDVACYDARVWKNRGSDLSRFCGV